MVYKIIFLIIALLGGIYSILLDVVKFRSANNPTPENVSDVYDAESYAKWKVYSAEHSRVDIIASTVSLVATFTLLLTNAFSAFASLFPRSFFWQLFAVILLETIVGSVLNVVFSYIKTMIIEQKYGFNKSTMKTFIFDCIRGLLIGLILSTALGSLIFALYFVSKGSILIVLYLTAAMFCFTMLISFLFPYLSRIGNKFTPLEDGELKDKLMELLTGHGYEVRAIEIMDASRRTTKINAYIAGLGKSKTIVLYDNMLEAMTTDEICAVFAHELGHGIHKHVLKRQILNIGYLVLMSLAVFLVVSDPTIYNEFGFGEINFGFAYILTSIAIGLIQPLVNLVINASSRAHEYEADKQAVKEGYGEAMIVALKKLARDNFSHLSPSRLNVIMEYSHPPISQRIEAVEKEIAKQK